MTDVRRYHCDVCGEYYESGGHEAERSDGMMYWSLDTPHRCRFPNSTFFECTEKEYRYREGVLYEREVTYRKYSGNDVREGSPDLLATSSWKKSAPQDDEKEAWLDGRARVKPEKEKP